MTVHDDRGLLALQGPAASKVLQKLTPADLSKLYFGMFARFAVDGIPCWVTRTGCVCARGQGVRRGAGGWGNGGYLKVGRA